MPGNLKEIVDKETIEFQEQIRPLFKELWKKEKQEIVKMGMKLKELPTPEAEKMLDTFTSRTLTELVLKKDADYGPKLEALMKKLRK